MVQETLRCGISTPPMSPWGQKAFEQVALKAQETNNPSQRYWAMLGQGDVAVAQGNLPVARELYAMALGTAEPIAKADPGNAGWQRDLALSHGRVAMILLRQGERERALSAFRQGREIILKLKAAAPSNATLPKDLAWFDGQIGGLQKR